MRSITSGQKVSGKFPDGIMTWVPSDVFSATLMRSLASDEGTLDSMPVYDLFNCNG